MQPYDIIIDRSDFPAHLRHINSNLLALTLRISILSVGFACESARVSKHPRTCTTNRGVCLSSRPTIDMSNKQTIEPLDRSLLNLVMVTLTQAVANNMTLSRLQKQGPG